MTLFFYVCCLALATGSLGQLVLGPCPLPPKHLVDVDLGKYSGRWRLSATTSGKEDDLACSQVHYTYNANGGELKVKYLENSPFVSGSNSGRFRPRKGKPGEFDLLLDDFPRRWHHYVLYTDYDSVAVEYRCLDSVFSPTVELTVLSRDARAGNIDELVEEHSLQETIPKQFLKKLASVRQNDCNRDQQ